MPTFQNLTIGAPPVVLTVVESGIGKATHKGQGDFTHFSPRSFGVIFACHSPSLVTHIMVANLVDATPTQTNFGKF